MLANAFLSKWNSLLLSKPEYKVSGTKNKIQFLLPFSKIIPNFDTFFSLPSSEGRNRYEKYPG